jgi:hypothetical protein
MNGAPIILLREGTEQSQGKRQIISNIQACMVVADAVRTTLGPRGMDKLIVEHKGGMCVGGNYLFVWCCQARRQYQMMVQRL